MSDDISIATLPQGDLRLLEHPTARRLLNAAELARLGYVAKDGTPRVVPVGYLWTGGQLVLATFAASPKVAALGRRPEVALTIDRSGPPPEVLMLRGRAITEEVHGVPREYREMQERYYGAEQAAAVVAQLERSGARMVRIVLRPSWVGVFDFRTRLPGVLAAERAL